MTIPRPCEERSDEAIHPRDCGMDCFAALAMTGAGSICETRP